MGISQGIKSASMIANKLSFATVFLVFAVPIITSIILRYLTPPIDHGTGSMFDLIASRYDFINRVLSLNLDTGWRRTLVKEVTSNGDIFKRQKEKIQILDLATGTADLAILLAKQYELVAPTDVRASILRNSSCVTQEARSNGHSRVFGANGRGWHHGCVCPIFHTLYCAYYWSRVKRLTNRIYSFAKFYQRFPATKRICTNN